MTDEEAATLYTKISQERLGGVYTGYKSLTIDAMQRAYEAGYQAAMEMAVNKFDAVMRSRFTEEQLLAYGEWLDEQVKKEGV